MLLVLACVACGPQHVTGPGPLPARRCDDGTIAWAWNTDAARRRQLDAWCNNVGPPLVVRRSAAGGSVSALRIVTWNIHVGAARVDALVARLRGSDPSVGLVLLLQEAFRSGDAVPTMVRSGESAAARIRPRTRTGDVVAIAAAMSLDLAYVPSMRNGDDDEPAEDRGSAILSSEPLSDITAIELPFGKQRRVAVMATLTPRGGRLPPLRVIAAHLDTPSANLQQAESLAAFLARAAASGDPLVLGLDSNATWGSTDPSVKVLDRTLARVRRCGRGPTSRWFARVDFLFTNLSPTVIRRCETFATFGSDHRPVVLTISEPSPVP